MKIINKFLQEADQQSLTIYCDLDGVLVDFDKAVESLGYGTSDEISKRGGESLLWALVNKAGINFWVNAKWTSDGKELWNFVKPYRTIILSSPGRLTRAPKGKLLWVRRELGPGVLLILRQAKKKMELANEKSILIDDNLQNIMQWKKAGGIAILHKESKTTIDKLMKLGFT